MRFRLPKNMNSRNINIYCEVLNSTENISFDGFHGGGSIKVQPKSGTSISNVNSLSFAGNNGIVVDVILFNRRH